MYERQLNKPHNEAVVTAPLVAEHRRHTSDKFRSQVTRDGTTSLEIEVRRRGITDCERCSLIAGLAILLGFVTGGIVFVVYMVEIFGATGLLPLIGVVFSVVIIFMFLSSAKSSVFTQANLKNTRNDYCLIQRGITWTSFLQIIFLPSHFNDLESGHFVETNPKESKYDRHDSLRAQVVTHHDEDSTTTNISLGSISFAQDLDDEELGLLTAEINCFLQQA